MRLPALKPAGSSGMIFRLWMKSTEDDLQHDFAWMADKSDGSEVLAQLQVSFIWESDNQGFSPIDWSFSCLQDRVAD